MRAVRVGLIVGLIVMGPAAFAFPGLLATFKSTYKPDPNTALGKANCMTCHQAKGFKLNPYGEELKKVMDQAQVKTLNADLLKKVEALDSDKDGFSNIDEIKAGTLPGDPTSHPAK